MPRFSSRSLIALRQAHPKLQEVAYRAIERHDFTVICGHRGRAEQEAAYRKGTSNARFGQSPHNFTPSLAIDIVPYPLDWDDTAAFKKMGDVFMSCARELKIPVRWGADWDRDDRHSDESFLDWPHFELHPWRSFKS